MARTSHRPHARSAQIGVLISSALFGGFLLWLGLPPVVVAAPMGLALGVVLAQRAY